MSFQGLEQLWRRDGEAIGQLRLSTAVENEAGAYQVHPAFLDAAFQALAAALPRGDVGQSGGSIFLPVGLDTLRLHARPGADLWSHAVLRSGADGQSGTIEGDVRVIDAEGHVVLEALGFTLQRVGHDAAAITEKQLKSGSTRSSGSARHASRRLTRSPARPPRAAQGDGCSVGRRSRTGAVPASRGRG